jgi:hypothetical protein
MDKRESFPTFPKGMDQQRMKGVADEVMKDEPELSKLSKMREKMLAALEKKGKKGFINDISKNSDDPNCPGLIEWKLEGNIDGHEICVDLLNRTLILDGKDFSELYEKFNSEYANIAYPLRKEKGMLEERSERLNNEKSLKDAAEILF